MLQNRKFYILKLNNKFYRVFASRLEVRLMERYATKNNLKYSAYYSKHKKGKEFPELTKDLGLKLERGQLVRETRPKTYEPDRKFFWTILGLILIQMIFLALASGSIWN